MKRNFIALMIALIALPLMTQAQQRRAAPTKKTAPSTYSSPSYSTYSYSSSSYENEIQAGLTVGTYTSQDSISSLQVRGSYARLIQPQLQLGAEASLSSVSGSGASSSTFAGFGFANYNFDTDLTEAFYAKGGLGIFSISDNNGDNESKFGFMLGGGKRFPLWDRILYNPEVRLFKVGDLDPYFEILFLNLSIHF